MIYLSYLYIHAIVSLRLPLYVIVFSPKALSCLVILGIVNARSEQVFNLWVNSFLSRIIICQYNRDDFSKRFLILIAL